MIIWSKVIIVEWPQATNITIKVTISRISISAEARAWGVKYQYYTKYNTAVLYIVKYIILSGSIVFYVHWYEGVEEPEGVEGVEEVEELEEVEQWRTTVTTVGVRTSINIK